MKISVMSIAFRDLYRKGEIGISDFIRICAQLGLDGVEITGVDEAVCASKEGVHGSVEGALEETGLTVSSYNLNVPLLSADETERTEAWRAFREGLGRAGALRARQVMLFLGPLEYTDPDRERKRWIEVCKTCAAYAEAEGILLTTENVGFPRGIPVRGKAAHMREIVEGVDSPFFRLTFDTGNFVMAGEDPAANLRELVPFVAHVHLKDVAHRVGVVIEKVAGGSRYTEVAIGTGIIDFQPIFEELKMRGYAGSLSIECAGPGDRAAKERMVEISVQNTREMLANTNWRLMK